MTRAPASLDPGYFEALYAENPDPWAFATSDYERDKYGATLLALPRPRYARAFEPGCSIGVLTAALAGRCDALLAADPVEEALTQARARCAGLPGVEFARLRVPGEWPAGVFDLVVLSEVVYYLDAADVDRLATRVGACLAPAGDVLLVHWTGETNYPLSGDAAATRFIAAAPFAEVTYATRTDSYRLDGLRRVSGEPSEVATRP